MELRKLAASAEVSKPTQAPEKIKSATDRKTTNVFTTTLEALLGMLKKALQLGTSQKGLLFATSAAAGCAAAYYGPTAVANATPYIAQAKEGVILAGSKVKNVGSSVAETATRVTSGLVELTLSPFQTIRRYFYNPHSQPIGPKENWHHAVKTYSALKTCPTFLSPMDLPAPTPQLSLPAPTPQLSLPAPTPQLSLPAPSILNTIARTECAAANISTGINAHPILESLSTRAKNMAFDSKFWGNWIISLITTCSLLVVNIAANRR